jgi:hypothetical protein
VLNAVRLMYAGAAYALIYAIGFIAVADAYIARHPRAATRYDVTSLGTGVVLASLIEIALWLCIARACRRGKNWARVTGTALFGIYTVGALGVLANPHPGIAVTKLLTVVSWLIGCAAVVLLWQPPSNAFFRGGRRPPAR